MHISIPDHLTSPSEIIVSHKGEEILWVTKTYARIDRYRPFDLTNALLERLPEDVQDFLFQEYKKIYLFLKTEFNDSVTVDAGSAEIRKSVTKILNCFDFDTSREIVKKQDITIPEKIRDHNRRMDPDRTYTAEQYLDLLVICAIMPTMAPIVGEYASQIGSRVAHKNKEQEYCYELMIDSDIFMHPAMERLRIFVDASYSEKNAEASPSTVLIGDGTESVGNWAIALIFVRTIFINKVLDKNTNMVSVMFNYIRTNLETRNLNRRSGGGVTSKGFGRTAEQDDETRGYLEESFRLKRTMSEGNIVMISAGFDHAVKKMFEIFPQIDHKHYMESIANISAYMRDTAGGFKITEIQTLICQIAMSRVKYHRNVPNLDRTARIKCIAVTQALAFALGHPHIAALLTAREDPRPNLIGSNSSGTRYAADVRQQMRESCPYIRVQNPTDTEPKTPIEEAVDSLINSLASKDYTNRSPKYVGILPPTLILPTDLRSQLARFILKINDRGSEKHV